MPRATREIPASGRTAISPVRASPQVLHSTITGSMKTRLSLMRPLVKAGRLRNL